MSISNQNFGFLAPAIEEESATQIIHKRLIDLDVSIQELANEFGCKREELSMLINNLRPYYKLRRRLCLRLGLNYERLWGKPTNFAANRRRAQIKAQIRRAA